MSCQARHKEKKRERFSKFLQSGQTLNTPQRTTTFQLRTTDRGHWTDNNFKNWNCWWIKKKKEEEIKMCSLLGCGEGGEKDGHSSAPPSPLCFGYIQWIQGRPMMSGALRWLCSEIFSWNVSNGDDVWCVPNCTLLRSYSVLLPYSVFCVHK